MSEKIDVERCLRAMADIYVSGAADTLERRKAVEEAIVEIQKDGTAALMKEYIGVKIYAGFGEQGSNHSYGCGPRHGDIVFSIGRTGESRQRRTELGPDHVYLLECARDWKAWEEKQWKNGRHVTERVGLTQALKEYVATQDRIAFLRDKLDSATVESHELTPALTT